MAVIIFFAIFFQIFVMAPFFCQIFIRSNHTAIFFQIFASFLFAVAGVTPSTAAVLAPVAIACAAAESHQLDLLLRPAAHPAPASCLSTPDPAPASTIFSASASSNSSCCTSYFAEVGGPGVPPHRRWRRAAVLDGVPQAPRPCAGRRLRPRRSPRLPVSMWFLYAPMWEDSCLLPRFVLVSFALGFQSSRVRKFRSQNYAECCGRFCLLPAEK